MEALKTEPYLAFEPEPLAALRGRFVEAVRRVVEPGECVRRPESRPGLDRRHVFDFENGIRVICSRDRVGRGGRALLHFSASLDAAPGFELNARLAALTSIEHRRMEFLAVARGCIGELRDGSADLRFIGVTQKGVGHWVVE